MTLFAEVFRGTATECAEFVRHRGWDRPGTKTTRDWEIKQDGIVKTETGEQRFLVLTDREVA